MIHNYLQETLFGNEFAMFGKDFYPTPESVIKDMLSYSNVKNKVILEPSAGKGNIVDYLAKQGAKEILVCEIDEKLRAILATKQCRIIGNNFLDVQSTDISHIQMIVMNPPFSQQEKHILHAWEIAPAGCEIISLCNASLLERKQTKQLTIQELVTKFGKYETYGESFTDAERKTDVAIACIWLNKPKNDHDIEFSDYFSLEDDFEPQNYEAGIVKYDFVKDAVTTYVNACKMYDDVMAKNNEINNLIKHFDCFSIKFNAVYAHNAYSTVTYESFKKELQKNAWKWLLDKFGMDKYITKGVREDMNKFVETQTQVPFTVKNIYKMVELLIGTHAERMKKSLISTFDYICSTSAENSTAGEKWRTNSDYMINKRFIIPRLTEPTYKDYYGFHVSYDRAEAINDIIKALCYITGFDYSDTMGLEQFSYNNELLYGQWYDYPPFFRIKGFMKGTIHFEFKDEKVWEKFNREVAKIKGWALPKNSEETKRERKKTNKRDSAFESANRIAKNLIAKYF